jgi:hypothetical protein
MVTKPELLAAPSVNRSKRSTFLILVIASGCTGDPVAIRPADAGSHAVEAANAAGSCVSLFAGGLGMDAGAEAVSFRGDLMPLFGQRCTFGGCHDGRETTGQLRLGDPCVYDPLRGVCTLEPDSTGPEVARVIHGNLLSPSNAAPLLKRAEPYRLDRSFMLYKLSGCQNAFSERTGCTRCGDVMPPNDPLRASDPDVFATIARWIAQGAALD